MRFNLILTLAFLTVSVGLLAQQPYPVKWNDKVGVTDNGGMLTRTAAPGAWNSGANAFNVLPANTDGWIEFTIDDVTTSIGIIGLSTNDASFDYTTTEYGVYFYNTALLYMESGAYVQFATTQLGDVVRISREGGYVKYYVNGTVLRQVPASKSKAWKVKGLVLSGHSPAIRCSFDVQLFLTSTISRVMDNGTKGGIQVTTSGGSEPYSYQWASGETTPGIANKDVGYYTVEVSDANGRKVSGTYYIGHQAQVIYVRKGAPTPGTGSSWTNAYPDLQQALTDAVSLPGFKEIWVAQGEYKPTQNLDRTVSFTIPQGTSLFGGFSGGETSINARDRDKNRTILSGDLGVLFDKTDNSYHVLVANGIDQNSWVDGFIITQGNANGTPGAFYNNCGGGLLSVGKLIATRPRINNCTFFDNAASSYGGGASNISDGSPNFSEITNCFFNGNKALNGGAIANYGIAGINSPSIINCSFSINYAGENGGAIATVASGALIMNSTFSKNSCILRGGAVYNSNTDTVTIKNSIFWKNFKGIVEGEASYNQVENNASNPIIQYNIIQGGYGVASDKNINADPLFLEEPNVTRDIPRTSVIPIAATSSSTENIVGFSGPIMPGIWAYYSYYDNAYNKLYISGVNIQVLDFNNLTNNLPTSTVHADAYWGRIQRLENSILENKIYISTTRKGILVIDRANGAKSFIDPLQDEAFTHGDTKSEDVVIDKANGLLYSPIFYFPENKFYGLLELNLRTNSKRWINKTSTPIAIPNADLLSNDALYWGIHRLYLDEVSNTLYYAMGSGVWWWNRSNNTTGIYDMAGGIPLAQGNPGLPSNQVTHIYIDHVDNKFYFGTHAGLFVWNRTNNTSKIYNKDNSLMSGGNLVNHIEKNEEQHLIYVSCEEGGLFTINTQTGEQKYMTDNSGHEILPKLVGTEFSSSYLDKTNKKLYISASRTSAGIWIKDYNNSLPDFGNLTLQDNSPAIDQADESILPLYITVDINGANRLVNDASVLGTLDLGAYEKFIGCQQPALDFAFEKSNGNYSFTPIISQLQEGCTISYAWNFGDTTLSSVASPIHTYTATGEFAVSLKATVKCGTCPRLEIVREHTVSIERGLCGTVFCAKDGVGIGTDTVANGYRLSVHGKIITEGAKINMQSRWPDYVFKKDYNLKPLPELKNYILKNRRLPNMPSALEVKKNGIDLGDMSVLLLEKTEELTLYLLNLEDRLKKIECNSSRKNKP